MENQLLHDLETAAQILLVSKLLYVYVKWS